MSPPLLLLLLLLVSFSLHACNARFLGFTDNKELSKLNSIPSEMFSPIQEEVGKIDHTMRIHENENSLNNIGATTIMIKQKKEQAFSKEGESIETGVELIVSSHGASQYKDKIKGWKRQSRFLLGSPPSGAEEAVESKQNGVAEDVVVMDYAQPHRKPPIHNEKS